MKSIKTTFVRGLSLLLALVIMLNVPISAFAADEDGIEAYAYTYDDERAEMMAHPAFSALKYLGYDRNETMENAGTLFDVITSKVDKANRTSIGYNNNGLCTGQQTSSSNTGYLDVQSATGLYPNVSWFEAGKTGTVSNPDGYAGMDCADYAAYYLTNYLPNIENVDIDWLDDILANHSGQTYDNMFFWSDAREELRDAGVKIWSVGVDDFSTSYTTNSSGETLEHKTITKYTDPDGKVKSGDIYNELPIGCLIQMGRSGNANIHYAIYAGSYNGKHYMYHCGNSRGPEISIVEYMWTYNSGSKQSLPLYFYDFSPTMVEENYGSITVYKDDPDGKPLAGAKFLILNTETGEDWDITTDSTGYASQDELPLGTYTIREIVAPDGYELDDTVWTVKLTEEDPTGGGTIHVTNTPKTGSLKIFKDILPSSAATSGNLAGWQFNVYKNSPSYTTTIRSGVKYRVKMTNADTGDVLYSDTASFTVQSNPAIKILSHPQSDAVSEGDTVTFNVAATSTTGKTLTYRWYYQTVENPGTWTATSASTGSSTSYSITMAERLSGRSVKCLISDGTNEVWSNEAYLYLDTLLDDFAIVDNLDSASGAKGDTVTLHASAQGSNVIYEWQVSTNSGITWTTVTNSAVGTYTTDTTGTVQVNDLPAGSYYVEEIDTGLDGWAYDLTSKVVTVTADNTAELPVTVTFTNELLQGGVMIVKVTEDNKYLTGWRFGLYSDASCEPQYLLSQATTISGGRLQFTDLAPGTYWVKELGHISATVNDLYYCASENPQMVTVEAEKTTTVRFENKLNRGSIEIIKKGNNGELLSGAEFQAVCNSNLYDFTEDAENPGYYYLNDVPYGTYTIIETVPPAGYEIGEPGEWEVTLGKNSPNGMESITIINEEMVGSLEIQKETNTDLNKDGWLVNVYRGSVAEENLLPGSPFTTDADGMIVITDLPIDTYIAVEINDGKEMWIYGLEEKSVEVPNRGTGYIEIFNTQLGYGQILKDTTNGGTKEGWLFEVKDADGNALDGSPFATNAEGKIDLGLLLPGDYTVQEIGHNSMTADQLLYWTQATEPQTLTVEAGATKSVTFLNQWQGKGLIVKTTVNGGSAAGWQFEVWQDGTDPITVTTNDNGEFDLGLLAPGTYYVKEVGHVSYDLRYWIMDTEVKELTIEAGKSSSVSFRNVWMGELVIDKKAVNSDLLAGWTGDLYLVNADGSETKIGTYTSDANGRFAELLVAPGKYIFRETGHSDSSVDLTYWVMAGDKEIEVNAGATASATIINTELGYGQILKDTTNGGTKEGWIFEIKDQAGNVMDGAFITDADGNIALGLLTPGSYTVQEIGHNSMTTDQLAYWVMDSETKTLVVEAGSTASVRFENQWQGMGRIKKEMPDGGSVAGWTFDVYRVSDNAYIGEFTSEENGDIALGYLTPGEYRVIEQVPENSLYRPVGGNEKILTVVAGEIKSVTFSNVLRSGEIIVNKVDGSTDAALAGAKFLLEWLDNDVWKPVILSDTIIPGGCRSEGLENGCLVTGEDGRIVFEGLHPDYQYRVTEVEAPNGYALQSAPVFEGKLPVDTLTTEVEVLNYGIIVLPSTGVEAHLTGLAVFAAIMVCLFFAMVALAIKEGMLTEFIRKHRK